MPRVTSTEARENSATRVEPATTFSSVSGDVEVGAGDQRDRAGEGHRQARTADERQRGDGVAPLGMRVVDEHEQRRAGGEIEVGHAAAKADAGARRDERAKER